MTQDEIIEMAKQAGGMFSELPMMDAWVFDNTDKCLEAFAKLVAQHTEDRLTDIAIKSTVVAVETAMALENEACARVCEDLSKDMTPIAEQAVKTCATLIRARKA